MTKTYNDIDAVTRLLEEKERDLELAARIGQSLLEQNKDIRQRNELLEQELAVSNETITRLKHDLAVKSGLLQIYTQDLDADSESGSPTDPKVVVNFEVLSRRVQSLEEENIQLRSEASIRTTDIENEEKKEMQLINDCVKQLSEANFQLVALQDDVSRKTDDNLRQQEEITHLLSQVVELQQRVRNITSENDHLETSLIVSKECQAELSLELIELKDKYAELSAAFQELQEESKKSRKNYLPSTSKWPYANYNPYVNSDSLASELESSLGRDSDGYASDERSSQHRRIFETVRYASSIGPSSRHHRRCSSGMLYTSPSISYSAPRPTTPMFPQASSFTCINDSIPSDAESAYADSYHTDDDSQCSSLSSVGRHGPPRPNELDISLRRLSSGVATDAVGNHDFQSRCRTPDSLASFGSGRCGTLVRHYHMPEKLQIIKPLEGSQTLHHWQKLATPHLGGIFEHRPGVQIKGERKVEELEEAFALSDFEEDEECYHPGKSFMNTSSVYTFTTSTILHPSDHTRVTSSYPGVQVTHRQISEPPSTLNSPQQHREKTASSVSITRRLARVLNERGIHGVVPNVTVAHEKTMSPTPTPCPSPEGSRPPSPVLPDIIKIPDLVAGSIIHRGMHLLRSSRPRPLRSSTSDTTVGCVVCTASMSSLENPYPSATKMGLLEKLNHIGLENIMCTTASPSLFSSALPCTTHKGRILSPAVSLSTVPDSSPLTMTSQSSVTSKTAAHVPTEKLDHSSLKIPIPNVGCSNTPVSANGVTVPSPLSHPWGYVPSLSRGRGMTPTVIPPLSYMPNPVLQLNSFRHHLAVRTHQDVGTVGTLRTLRKGGYC